MKYSYNWSKNYRNISQYLFLSEELNDSLKNSFHNVVMLKDQNIAQVSNRIMQPIVTAHSWILEFLLIGNIPSILHGTYHTQTKPYNIPCQKITRKTPGC